MPTLDELEGIPLHDGRLPRFVFQLSGELRTLVDEGARSLTRRDNVHLAEVCNRYNVVRGEHGKPADILPYLAVGYSRPYKTVRLAVVAILRYARPDMSESAVRRYMYYLRPKTARRVQR
jgi:hypothetical protein